MFTVLEKNEITLIRDKSSFIGILVHATSAESAKQYLIDIKKEYPKAKHYCYAYSIGGAKKSSDDGEPSGTAGRPMLDVLSAEHVTNACVVVTRYFGGTLLGTGGLVRAYSAAVKAGLENCTVIRKTQGFSVKTECDYNDSGKITNMAAKSGYRIQNTDWGEFVTITVLTDEPEKYTDDVTDVTSGRARISEPVPAVYAEVDGEIMIFD